jgi:hypothetical protein
LCLLLRLLVCLFSFPRPTSRCDHLAIDLAHDSTLSTGTLDFTTGDTCRLRRQEEQQP